ncbi:MAG TPA: aminotransferase class III-fold pyridoxal phosphate-dependent enzyme, partial [Steroidobacteraceae bacterium]|nr:aminotransferase class III-fold pyridoxal phosphate-dependent enzyme [Steroidobacteraceae bacterium]
MPPAELRARRARLLAPTYQLFYDEPLQIVRAADVWMYDEQGRAYLDAYNNVPVVGHCQPQVVEALARQAATLNTHTRYLAELPLQLAEELLATLPPQFAGVIFTCTGSEANDLAVRICKAATGGTGFIVTEFAYHGATDVIAGMSPEDGGPLGPGVYTVPAPLGAAGAAAFAAAVRRCLERMRADGVRPAALLVDTIFASDGVAAHPAGFLAEAAGQVRAAGALFIADEVQPGFGRVGEAMWGFQRHGVIPDLVTMGKPMGNGHPVAALAGHPGVLAAFARRTRYFNTYGGNSVSCAAAL